MLSTLQEENFARYFIIHMIYLGFFFLQGSAKKYYLVACSLAFWLLPFHSLKHYERETNMTRNPEDACRTIQMCHVSRMVACLLCLIMHFTLNEPTVYRKQKEI